MATGQNIKINVDTFGLLLNLVESKLKCGLTFKECKDGSVEKCYFDLRRLSGS